MSRKTYNKDKGRKKITVLELSNYNAPKVVEEYGRKFIFWGNRNKYFDYIRECYLGSTTNSAIISSITTLMYGKGIKEVDDKDIDKVIKLLNPIDLRLIINDFYMFGKACFQVGYSSGKREIIKIQHHPVSSIAKGKKNKNGKTEVYYYSSNWQSFNNSPIPIPAFGTSKEKIELIYIDGNVSLDRYYSDVNYQAGLQYCKMEEEISNFHINNIKNGFSPSVIINFNNGIPETEELQRSIEQDVYNKWGGSSKAGKAIISFNNGLENAPTIDAVQLSDADKQYQHVTDLAQSKIMVSHKVTSPLLLGLGSANGFSSNADELKNAYLLFNISVIRPLQDIIIEAVKQVTDFNNWNDLDLYFEPLMPYEFTDENAVTEEAKDEVQKETGVEMSAEEDLEYFFEDFDGNVVDVRNYCGDAPKGYEFLRYEDVDGEDESVDYEALMNEFEVDLASTQHNPRAKSEQDSPRFKVRYTYIQGHDKPITGSRKECNTLIGLSGQQKYWRKEDIIALAKRGYGSQYKHPGQSYQNIWMYKMGRNCSHLWRRVIFEKTVLEENKIPVSEARRKGFYPPTNESEVSIAPRRMPNKGAYPE